MIITSLFKQSSDVQVAHLYEHIFCAHVSSFLRENGLFAYVDYHLDGKTYSDGLIAIRVDLYTEPAKELKSEIAKLVVEITDETVEIALQQAAAEKQGTPRVDYDELVRALSKLNDSEWLDIDELDVLTEKIEDAPQTLEFDDSNEREFVKTHLAVSMRTDENLTPGLKSLFNVLAWAIVTNLQEDLSDGYGLFTLSDSFSRSTHELSLTNTFSASRAMTMTDEEEVITDLLDGVLSEDVLERLLNELRAVDYSRDYYAAPSVERTYSDTGVILGGKGWKNIATLANAHGVLKQMQVSYSVGDDSITVDVADLL